ncbi:Tripartite tricarboxylate transporter TctA family [Proteus mirabilis]|uniref:Tripartite tricarboxylate transporter TctA family n=1 Tax=Proteus mirabilis TaxID=584 RepID=A0A379GDN5_PROMI|nr:Tripartite tricarboxylate transporter TctA family [Proteus mirabilis]
MTAGPRFTFDTVYLMGGVSFIPILVGLFAFSQGLISFEEEYRERKQKKSEKINARIHRVLPTWLDFNVFYLPIFVHQR